MTSVKCECCGWMDSESPCPACRPYIEKAVAAERERCVDLIELYVPRDHWHEVINWIMNP